jgi:hypothetical protein
MVPHRQRVPQPLSRPQPGNSFIKLFSSSLMTTPNKLEQLSLETLSSQVLEFESKARANPILMLPSWISSWCYQKMLD